MAEKFTVRLFERSYPIEFAADVRPVLQETLANLAASKRRLAVVTDKHLAKHQPALLRSFGDAPVFVADPGEESKSLTVFGQILDFLAEAKMDRGGALFAVGGGVIGDLGGFAAASWLRGIDLFQVPTTLLSMVDSSVGGKTGINIAAGKNLVGAFHQPRGVFVGTDLLKTLPPREFAAGMAEVIKYGLLGDAGLFSELESATLTMGSPALSDVIRQCCALKARIVEADERELAADGGRALLNLGHTFGHAIENVAGYGTYLHGEAVAIGLCAAARLSQKLGHINTSEVSRIERVISAHHLPVRLRAPLAIADLLGAMSRDKKVRSGLPRFVILRKLGEAATCSTVELSLATECFKEIGAR
jgi:3-dehydroquinate synthase